MIADADRSVAMKAGVLNALGGVKGKLGHASYWKGRTEAFKGAKEETMLQHMLRTRAQDLEKMQDKDARRARMKTQSDAAERRVSKIDFGD